MISLSKFRIFSIPFFEPSAQKNGHFWGFLIKMVGLGTWIFNFQSSKIGVTLVFFKKIDFFVKSVILSWFSKKSIFFNFFGKKILVPKKSWYQNSKFYLQIFLKIDTWTVNFTIISKQNFFWVKIDQRKRKAKNSFALFVEKL